MFEKKWEQMLADRVKVTTISSPKPSKKVSQPIDPATEIERKIIHERHKCSIKKTKSPRSVPLKALLDRVELFKKYRKHIPAPGLLL